MILKNLVLSLGADLSLPLQALVLVPVQALVQALALHLGDLASSHLRKAKLN